MSVLPLQGTPGVYDPRNPTLLPNFNLNVASGSTVDHADPQTYLTDFPRVDATVTATIGGTITATDTVALTITHTLLPSGSLTVTYTVGASDTVDSIADGLADLINDSATAQNLALRADVAKAVITLRWNGPVGNFAVLTDAVTGSATETVTLGNSGVFSGGSGPVIATNNFNFQSGNVMSFFYGNVYPIGYDLITQLVNQAMPIA